MKAKLILLKKSTGKLAFNMKLTDKGKRTYKAIEVPFTEKEWNYNPKKGKNELKKEAPTSDKYEQYEKNKDWVEAQEKKYNSVISEQTGLNKPVSFNIVKAAAEKPKELESKTVFQVWETIIKEFRAKNKFGTADNYSSTLGKFKNFHKNDLMFYELNDELLLKFKKSMEGLSLATISIHLRTIRAVYRYAIKKKIADLSNYPFTNDEIMKELNQGYKSRAISKTEVDKIRKLKKESEQGSDIWHSCNYFLFGYMGRGINFQDMARLKWENIKKGKVTYIRFKTRSKIQHETSFTLNTELAEIVEQYREIWKQGKNFMHNPYVFPILNLGHRKELTIYNRIKKERKNVNKALKKVSEKIESETKISTYTWRHSFASISKNELDIDVAMISQSLGHQKLETTQHYLKQFDVEKLDKAFEGL